MNGLVCSDHFRESDLIVGAQITRLMPNSVPTLHIPSSLIRAAEAFTNTVPEEECQQECKIEVPDGENDSNLNISTTQSEFTELINEELFDECINSENEELNDEDKTYLEDITSQQKSELVKCGYVTYSKSFTKLYYICCFHSDDMFPVYKWWEFCDHLAGAHNDLCEENLQNRDDDRKPLSVPESTCEANDNNASTNSLNIMPVIKNNSTFKLDSSDSNVLVNASSAVEKTDKENFIGEDSCARPDRFNTIIEHKSRQQSPNINCSAELSGGDQIQADYNEIRFGKTRSCIVIDFLERVKCFPCLWYTDLKFMDTYEAALDEIMNEMNDHWGLKLTKPVLRNNLESIKEYYNFVLKKRRHYENYNPRYDDYVKLCAGFAKETDIGKNNEVSTSNEPSKAILVPKTSQRFTGKKQINFICVICDREFHFESKYLNHMKLHTEEIRKYQCDICDRYYLTESMLRTHKKRHNAPKYFCSVCSKGYSYESNLKIHMKLHTGKLDIVCEWCGQGFIDKKAYLTHVKYKHNPEGHCNICNHSCQTAAALDKHLKTYHRPLTIDQDFKRVLTPQKLKNCKEDNRFRKRDNRFRKNTGRYRWKPDKDTGKLRVHCTECEKSYLSYDTLYAHIGKIHGYEAVRQSYAPNQTRKPNSGHFQRKHPKAMKIAKQNALVLSPNATEDANLSDSQIIDNECCSTFDISTNKTETFITNTQVKYDVADFEEIDQLMSDDVEFQ